MITQKLVTLVIMPYFTSKYTTFFSFEMIISLPLRLKLWLASPGGSPELNRGKKRKKLRKREIYLKYRKKVVIYGWNSRRLKPEKGGGQEDLIEFHQVKMEKCWIRPLSWARKAWDGGGESGRPTIGNVWLVIRVTRMCAKQVFIMWEGFVW